MLRELPLSNRIAVAVDVCRRHLKRRISGRYGIRMYYGGATAMYDGCGWLMIRVRTKGVSYRT